MPTALKPPVAPVPQTPAAQAPIAPQAPRPQCVVEEEADGSMVVTFTVSAPTAAIWRRRCGNRKMEDYVWNGRGLRHFENQEIV